MICHDCNKAPAIVHYVFGAARCQACSDAFQEKRRQQWIAERAAATCEECGEKTGGPDICSECCQHEELDHGTCMNCGEDRSEWASMAAYDDYKSARYGD
jgi:hypothetical protein